MKKLSTQFAALLFISGVLLFGLMHVCIAIYSSNSNSGLLYALSEIKGWIPYLLSITFMVIGGFIFLDEIVEERARKESQGKVYHYVEEKE
ncbi:MAG: hypothetical protein KKF57_13685 [Firmicutes bacterium]|nr:hypothetical protein [Bacillota bacterium]